MSKIACVILRHFDREHKIAGNRENSVSIDVLYLQMHKIEYGHYAFGLNFKKFSSSERNYRAIKPVESLLNWPHLPFGPESSEKYISLNPTSVRDPSLSNMGVKEAHVL